MCDFLFVIAFSKEVRMMIEYFVSIIKWIISINISLLVSQSLCVCVFFDLILFPLRWALGFIFISTQNTILCKCTNWNRAFNPINVKMLREIQPKTIIFKREKEYSVERINRVDIVTLFRCGLISILKLMNCNSI